LPNVCPTGHVGEWLEHCPSRPADPASFSSVLVVAELYEIAVRLGSSII